MTTDTSVEEKPKKQSEPVWQLCTSPVTLLISDGSRRMQAGGRATGFVGLRFERGPNILAGRVTIGGKRVHVELANLPRDIAATPETEREAKIVDALSKYRTDHPGHRHLFEGKPPTFIARGTLPELMKSHYVALREAASTGTHRPSLEAMLAHPAVDESIRELITRRLSAWRQEEAA